MNLHRIVRLTFLLCLYVADCSGQVIDLGLVNHKTSVETPFRLDLKKDLALSAGSLALMTTGFILKANKPLIDSQALLYPDISRIPSFDVFAIHDFDNSFLTLSNVLLYTATVMPFISFVDKRVSGHAPQIVAMYLETIALNVGVYSVTAGLVNRRRPLSFNTDTVNGQAVVPFDKKRRPGSLESFFSGHTSTAAAATFYGARIFSIFRPQSKLIPFVWGTAAAIPAFVGLSRVQAGKHFPSDVITGYVVGATIGYLVPTLHKAHFSDEVSISPMLNGKGFAATYTF